MKPRLQVLSIGSTFTQRTLLSVTSIPVTA